MRFCLILFFLQSWTFNPYSNIFKSSRIIIISAICMFHRKFNIKYVEKNMIYFLWMLKIWTFSSDIHFIVKALNSLYNVIYGEWVLYCIVLILNFHLVCAPFKKLKLKCDDRKTKFSSFIPKHAFTNVVEQKSKKNWFLLQLFVMRFIL